MSRPDIAKIYTEYHDRVMGYIYARLRSKADAEDLCQDVFEKVFRAAGRYDGSKSAPGTWIYSITRNAVIDYWRRSRPTEELP